MLNTNDIFKKADEEFVETEKSSELIFDGKVLHLYRDEIYLPNGKESFREYCRHIGAVCVVPVTDEGEIICVRQYRYAVRSNDIAVLAVLCGKNVHEIHPASHCLRTSQWTVNSEKIFHLRDNFAVTEIDARKGNTRILVWVWYSSTKFSTPGFLGFRRQFRPGGIYYTYQISVPVWGNIDESRAELKNFIQRLKRRYNHDAV